MGQYVYTCQMHGWRPEDTLQESVLFHHMTSWVSLRLGKFFYLLPHFSGSQILSSCLPSLCMCGIFIYVFLCLHICSCVWVHVCLARQYHSDIIPQVLISCLLWRQGLTGLGVARQAQLSRSCLFLPELPCQQFFFLSAGIKGEGKCPHIWPGF